MMTGKGQVAGQEPRPALSLVGAAKTFGPVVAVADGTIEIRAGEIHALVGENGAGKSTIEKILAGLYHPDAGQAGTNVIVIAANDPDAVGPALTQAREAGAKIVAFDSDTSPKYRDVFISQVVAKEVALIQTKLISEQIGGSGEIAILSATVNATNQNKWIKFMEAELTSNPAYKDVKLVAKVYGDDDDANSIQEAPGLMQAHPNLKGIISPTTVGIAATGRYLSKSTYKGKVALTGLGLPNEMRPFVKDGTVKAFALWDPAQLGLVAAYAGKALADGKMTGKEGDKFTARTLGERTVGKDGIVIVGPPTVFDAANIDKYDF